VANSNRASARRKPASDDRPDWRKTMGLARGFPLFPHGAKDQPNRLRWAKKVRGRLHYFGKVEDDPKGEAALNLWLDQKDDLLAGRTPRTKLRGLTVGELCHRFLQSKDDQLAAGEIGPLTRTDYKRTCDRLVNKFGKSRAVADLATEDFEALKASIAKTNGLVSLGNEITRTRVVFRYGVESGLIDTPIRYGPRFKRASKKVLRLARAKRGSKIIEPADLRRLIAAADTQMKAMVHLALNVGFGNADCGSLPLAALDLEGGWLSHHRSKTGVQRRCALWPETVQALREVIAKRPTPKSSDAEPLVFITRCGQPWAKARFDNPVCKAFRKLLDELGLHKAGLGFYSLRHVFRTIAGGAKDLEATRAIMGHCNQHVEDAYIETLPDDSRLRAVTEHVRRWLFAGEPEANDAAAKGGAARQVKAPSSSTSKTRKLQRQATAAAMEWPRLRVVG
jgi:integrase